MRRRPRLRVARLEPGAYRSWSIGEPPTRPPGRLIVEVALRVQRLASVPDAARVLAALGAEEPRIGGEILERTGPTIEQVFNVAATSSSSAIEVAYQGACHLDEAVLEEARQA